MEVHRSKKYLAMVLLFLVVGRHGIHHTGDPAMGSTAENLLRFSPCNVLITSREAPPEEDTSPLEQAVALPWTQESQARLENIPEFARSMARQAHRRICPPPRVCRGNA